MSTDNSLSGTMMCLNIWSEALSCDTLLASANCQTPGDVYTMNANTTTLHGAVVPQEFVTLDKLFQQANSK